MPNRMPDMFSENFPEPTTLRECHERMFELKNDVSKIRNQLMDYNRKDRLNLSEKEYDNWKRKANLAKIAKSQQVHHLDNWMKSQKTKDAIDVLSSENHIAVIGKLVDVISDIRQKHHVPLTNDERHIVTIADRIVNEFPTGK